jgi:hypothetical protein
MGRVRELIFGYGTTRCLGIPIAMMNLNKIFFEVSSPIWRSSDTDRNVAVQPLRYLDHQPPESVDESLLRDLLPKGL